MKYPETLDYRFDSSYHLNHHSTEKEQRRDKNRARLIQKLSIFLDRHMLFSWLFCYLAVPFLILVSVSLLATCVGGFILALC